MHLYIDKPDTLLVDKVVIIAQQLKPFNNYEFVLDLNHSVGTFRARALFKADRSGSIDLRRDAPIRGTYSGVDPMGLFQTVAPLDDVRYGDYCKCTPPIPFKYTLSLYSNVGELIDRKKLTKAWLHPAVTRTEIEESGVRGTLFKPPGDGPFPTIIDISGTGGGLNEHKGAALASDGFCVLCLAFFQFKDLPESLNDLDLNYFENAIDWLTSLTFTSNEIGFQGVSFGGLLSIFIASQYEKVIAAVDINGAHSLDVYTSMKHNGVRLDIAESNPANFYYINDLMCYDKTVGSLELVPQTVEYFKKTPKKTAFRFVTAEDDLSTMAIKSAKIIGSILKESGHKVEHHYAPGGHLLEPPYYPHLSTVFSKFAGVAQAYGGNTQQHGKSCELTWEATLKFFRKHLGDPPPLPEYLPSLTSSKL